MGMSSRLLTGSHLGLAVLLASTTACGNGGGGDPGMDPGTETDAQASTSNGQSNDGSSSGMDDPDSSGSGGGSTTLLDEVCEAASALLTTCGDMLDECDQGKLGACPEVFGHEREQMLEARAMCGFSMMCFGLTDFEQRLCIYQNTQDMEPTAAQTALAQLLCASCFPNDGACLSDFFFRAEPMEGSAGVSGLGASYLELTDAFTEQLASQCVPQPGTPGCAQTYLDCREELLMQDWPASLVTACEGPEVPD